MPTRRELANAIRALSMDAVQKANSGHPGAPMGMADIAEVLFRDVLKFNPGNPTWLDRDRFVLSNGHASMLLYSVLNLTGGHGLDARRAAGRRGDRQNPRKPALELAAVRNSRGHSRGVGHAREGCTGGTGAAREIHALQGRIPCANHAQDAGKAPATRQAWRWRPAPAIRGGAPSASMVRSSAPSTTARRHRRRSCSSISVSRRITSYRR